MAKFRGMGGIWFLPTPFGGGAVVHNAEYTVTTVVELKESRTTNERGWTSGLPVIRRLERAHFRVAEDDVSYPQVLGLTEGAEIPLIMLKRGSLNQWDSLTRAIVESVTVENDQKKARWVEIVLKHGYYSRQVAAPEFPDGAGGDFGGGGDF